MNEKEQINEILMEARAYSLEQEVESSAQSFIKQGYAPLLAYTWAFDEWIK